MKFKASMSDVKRALSVLSSIVNLNHQTLAFRYILIRLNNDRIEFKGYDDYTVGSAFITQYDLEGENKEAYILAKHFIGLISKFSGDEIKFNITDEFCKISVSKSRYALNCLDVEIAKEALDPLDIDYYDIELPGTLIKVDKFSTAYSSISHCLSKDSSVKVLQNIYLYRGKLIACDGVRGAVIDFESDLNEVLFHKKICDCILNTNANEVFIMVAGDKMYGKTADSIFVSMISEEYPIENIWKIINKFHEESEYPIDIEFDPDEVGEKLGRILLFADGETNAVSLSNEKKTLKLTVENKSSAEEYISAYKQNGESNEFVIFLDGKTFKESLSKSLSKTRWVAQSTDEIQYVYDGNLLQFFNGLDE